MAGAALLLGVCAGCVEQAAQAPEQRSEPAREPASAAAPPAAPPALENQDGPRVQPAASAPETQRTADMARIRETIARAPHEALALIARDEAMHAGDAHAEERAWLTVDALVGAQQIGRARAAAEEFLRRYPKSAQAERIRALTGVHVRPLGPRE